jgi:hypothetical protein
MRVLTRSDRLEVRLDEGRLTGHTLEQLAEATATPLPEILTEPHATPGVYLLGYTGTHPMYRPVAASGQPVYIGSTTALHDRLARHSHSVAQVEDLETVDLTAKLIRCPSWHAAVHLEGLLTDALAPLWNQRWIAGFGSRAQGPGRVRHQRRSAWDTLHPGRRWATGTVSYDRSELASRVRSYLASDEPTAPKGRAR